MCIRDSSRTWCFPFDSVRFGSVRFESVRWGSVRWGWVNGVTLDLPDQLAGDQGGRAQRQEQRPAVRAGVGGLQDGGQDRQEDGHDEQDDTQGKRGPDPPVPGDLVADQTRPRVAQGEGEPQLPERQGEDCLLYTSRCV